MPKTTQAPKGPQVQPKVTLIPKLTEQEKDHVRRLFISGHTRNEILHEIYEWDVNSKDRNYLAMVAFIKDQLLRPGKPHKCHTFSCLAMSNKTDDPFTNGFCEPCWKFIATGAVSHHGRSACTVLGLAISYLMNRIASRILA